MKKSCDEWRKLIETAEKSRGADCWVEAYCPISGKTFRANVEQSVSIATVKAKRDVMNHIKQNHAKNVCSERGERDDQPAQNAYGKRENTDHLPYCTACKKFVSPQVVASNKTASGITITSPDGLSSTRLHSSTKFHKFCPNCGNEVFSKRDLDESRSNAQQGCLVVAAALPLVFYAAARVVVYIYCEDHGVETASGDKKGK
jgi:hypothetical protein